MKKALLERIIDEAVYEMASQYKAGESQPVDFICGILAGKILKKAEGNLESLTAPKVYP